MFLGVCNICSELMSLLYWRLQSRKGPTYSFCYRALVSFYRELSFHSTYSEGHGGWGVGVLFLFLRNYTTRSDFQGFPLYPETRRSLLLPSFLVLHQQVEKFLRNISAQVLDALWDDSFQLDYSPLGYSRLLGILLFIWIFFLKADCWHSSHYSVRLIMSLIPAPWSWSSGHKGRGNRQAEWWQPRGRLPHAKISPPLAASLPSWFQRQIRAASGQSCR